MEKGTLGEILHNKQKEKDKINAPLKFNTED